MSSFRRSTDQRRLIAIQQAQLREQAAAETGFDRVRKVLESTRPATWVFSGDTIVQGGSQTGAGRTFSEHFADHARNKLRRLLDVVINTGVPNSRCENFLKTIDWRVTRFEPDVAVLMLGSTDATAGPAGRERFRDQLNDVIESLAATETKLILQTPPTARPDRWTDESDLPAYVEIIREVAKDRRVALIDHWALFEERLALADTEPDWWAAGGQLPNVRGHVELARQLVEALVSKL
ncbi:MAG: GDSL-type esterase/lipase family protein [Planctomycetia bacterium]|nr:GDSL-type esterase/lipase family protein [Planctomycetia bacterium]